MSLQDQSTDYELDKLLTTYRLDGSMIRGKARALIEDLLDRIYPRMQDPDTPTSTLLEIGKQLIVLGDLGPKTVAPGAGSGAGFSISINIPSPNGNGEVITIRGRASGEDEKPEVMEVALGSDTLGDAPAHISNFRVPDFNLNQDLRAGMVSAPGQPPAGPMLGLPMPSMAGPSAVATPIK